MSKGSRPSASSNEKMNANIPPTTKEYHILGLMSGTSLDGLDLAFCKFSKIGQKWEFELLKSKSIDYDHTQREKLKSSVLLTAEELLHLDILYGRWLGEQSERFIKEENIKVDWIASHGHTVFHQPEKGFTHQIGAGQELANYAQCNVICDFRSLDVSMGGQGAPLVPIGDRELFNEYDFCLNLGGISNVSLELNDKRIAYDIGPANMLLNYLSNQMGLAYDKGGRLAKEGQMLPQLLEQMNQLSYYQQAFPKSLGYEWFVEELKPIVDASPAELQDKLHTATHHVANLIISDILSFAIQDAKMLVTGGGAKNEYLINLLKVGLHRKVELLIPDSSIIDFKEAIVFGLMGAKYLNGEINCLSSVTGARKDVSGGQVFYFQA